MPCSAARFDLGLQHLHEVPRVYLASSGITLNIILQLDVLPVHSLYRNSILLVIFTEHCLEKLNI